MDSESIGISSSSGRPLLPEARRLFCEGQTPQEQDYTWFVSMANLHGSFVTPAEMDAAIAENPGPTGPAGPQGLTGPVGPVGPTGATGSQGPKGDKGDTGNQGIQGPAGATGSTGPTGATGSQGPKGDTGSTGATGSQGPTGATGATGASGVVAATAPVTYNSGTQTIAISACTTSAAGSMSAADKVKLDSLALASGSVQARSLNTAFQISATRAAFVCYSVEIACALSLTSGQSGSCFAEYADDSGFTVNVVAFSRITNAQTGALTIGLNLSQVYVGHLSGFVPAGKYCRIRPVSTIGSPTFTVRECQETLL